MSTSSLILFALIIVVMLIPNFMLVRKQKAARQSIVDFQASLSAGQRVVTAGGIHGTVVTVEQETVVLAIAQSVDVVVEKSAVIRAAGSID